MSATVATKPSQMELALARLYRLSQAGASPSRMAGETQIIIAAWRADEIAPAVLERRLIDLWDTLLTGLDAAEEAAANADTSEDGAVEFAQQIVAGLRAATAIAGDARMVG